MDSEFISVEAAIVEAEDRLALAQEKAAAEQDREQAQQLGEALREFTTCGKDLDAAFTLLIERANAMDVALTKMHRLQQVPFPSGMQLQVLGARCLLTALGQTPWHRHFEVISSAERRTFSNTVAAWHKTIVADIEKRLGIKHQQLEEVA